ncbi:MAG: hypothetical protein OXI74_10260 [Rhodospirillaceae bacterium]|nr:hypothetical protein [Rhodospirillaceae bacterium]
MAGDTAVFAAPLDGDTVDELRRAFDAELSGRIVGTVLGIRRQVFGCNGSAVCESVYEAIRHKTRRLAVRIRLTVAFGSTGKR